MLLVIVEHHQLNYINHEHIVVKVDKDERQSNSNPAGRLCNFIPQKKFRLD